MAHSAKTLVKIGQAVRFRQEGRELTGMLARLIGTMGFVLGQDRQSYQVPLEDLQSVGREKTGGPESESAGPEAGEGLRPRLSADTLQVGDAIEFVSRGRRLQGYIVRLNPKRAHVLCDDEAEYAVPYPRIERCAATVAEDSGQRLASTRQLAGTLLLKHGLQDWCFEFDHATRRAGCCDYRRKRIGLALQFARQASAAEIRDTLLHEIAHALVGQKHHHDAHWRAKALEIGGSGERCHSLRFCPPRYIMACRKGCWTATAERRRRNVVCRQCRGEIIYQTYTEQRWRELRAATGEQE